MDEVLNSEFLHAQVRSNTSESDDFTAAFGLCYSLEHCTELCQYYDQMPSCAVETRVNFKIDQIDDNVRNFIYP